tara:strand:+ start:534 stop:1040 length:507 start_codon:yes stop_codon:yes gene_type:complete
VSFALEGLDCSKNHYELLEVSSTVDSTTLRRAFCRLSKAFHPDTTSLPQSEAANRFQLLCAAYETLADPISRQIYDRKLARAKTHSQTEKKDPDFVVQSFIQSQKTLIGVRRPLSGGELFSLLLLGVALIISLLLGIGFAMAQGRELVVVPSWLVTSNMINQPSPLNL